MAINNNKKNRNISNQEVHRQSSSMQTRQVLKQFNLIDKSALVNNMQLKEFKEQSTSYVSKAISPDLQS